MGRKQEIFSSDLCPSDEFEGGKPNSHNHSPKLKVLGYSNYKKIKRMSIPFSGAGATPPFSY
jgi:hypothetical protein